MNRASQHTHPGDIWIERLAALLLGLTLLYGINGMPEFDRDTVLASDYVNPLNRWIWLGLLALSIPVLVRRWAEIRKVAVASWPLLCLYLYFAASTSWALDPAASTRRLLLIVVQLVLSLVLVCGVRKAATLHVLLIGVCLLAAVIDLGAWAAMPGYAMTDEGFAGLQTQKNQTGLMMMLGCLAAGTGFFLRPERLWRLAVGAALLLMAALLVATRSTTSQSIVLMSVVVVPALILVASQRPRVIWAIVLTALAGLAAAFVLYFGWCDLTGRDPLLPLRGVTFTARTDLWSFVLDEIAKRPLFGAGYASLWAIDPAIQPSLKTGMWFSGDVIINEGHEGYLDLLATAGIVGFAGGLAVVLRTLSIGFRAVVHAQPAARAWLDGTLARPTAVFHLALLVGLLVHNFTESNLFANNSVLAVAFILVAVDLEKWRVGYDAPALAERRIIRWRTGRRPQGALRG